MEPRRQRNNSGNSMVVRSVRRLLLLLCVVGAGLMVYMLMVQDTYPPPAGQAVVGADKADSDSVTSIQPGIVDFHMEDLLNGMKVLRKDEKLFELYTTHDGGVTWEWTTLGGPELVPITTRDLSNGDEAGTEGAAGDMDQPEYADRAAHLPEGYTLKTLQFVTENVGWALLAGKDEAGVGAGARLWVTTDRGFAWHDQVTAEVQRALEAEQEWLRVSGMEAAYFADREAADTVMGTEWSLLPGTVYPGDVVLVRSRVEGSVDWQGKNYKLQRFGTGYYTYLPVSTGVKPGKYMIGDQTLVVEGKSFETQRLTVTSQQNSMRQNTERIQQDQVKINKARSTSHPEFLFGPNSAFMVPVEGGRLTTPYGYTRYVNGEYAGSHLAIDLAAPTGTPIYATNDGIVVLAEELYLTGNAIYLDHGMGLFSQYAHMSELKVKAGDRVKRGDVIGLVGSTGFSTGPHLHFAFWTHNVPVNPNLFFGGTPFGWDR
jgi:murein DD-endopeptidase MepM/ murein hydrolase activator NlpD